MQIHHLALRTDDVDALARFYVEVFELSILRNERPRAIWLQLERGVMMIERREPNEPPIPAASLELVAFAADEAFRDAVEERARERGCDDGATEHTRYLRDPDGRRVAVSTYPLDRA